MQSVDSVKFTAGQPDTDELDSPSPHDSTPATEEPQPTAADDIVRPRSHTYPGNTSRAVNVSEGGPNSFVKSQKQWQERCRSRAKGNGTGLAVTWLGTSSGAPSVSRNISSIALRVGEPESILLVDAGAVVYRVTSVKYLACVSLGVYLQ